jgi:methionyl-tRNA formyltransferase
MVKTYIVIGSKSWNERIYHETISKYPGTWYYFNSLEPLTDQFLSETNPRYIFFLHWSYLVPPRLYKNYECICFHMTDVPFGRGGSPLQNLIERGFHTTKVSALRMNEYLDDGHVYYKKELSLKGNAEEIYIRATELSAVIIRDMIFNEPHPVPQCGEKVMFKRRTPEQSELKQIKDLHHIYDYIRMLDAESYPPAFIVYEGYRFEFTRASLYEGKIVSDVVITKVEEPV